jgi:hypothetical protein
MKSPPPKNIPNKGIITNTTNALKRKAKPPSIVSNAIIETPSGLCFCICISTILQWGPGIYLHITRLKNSSVFVVVFLFYSNIGVNL